MDSKKRFGIQAFLSLIQNANLKGFFTGKIYTGNIKQVCVPGLNCYSCPGAVGACPIGSLQNALSSYSFKFPYYVVGLLIFFGALFGRLICGFACPFGFLQDILYKIPFVKKIKHLPKDKYLRYLKYFILIFLVIVLPFYKKLTPFFCKYICPSGTLSGVLLSLSDHKLFSLFGVLFAMKAFILILIAALSAVIYRPFCKYLCPLGAFYGLFNRFSFVKLSIDKEKCTSCNTCANHCGMDVNPSISPNSAECIRCLKCMTVCPHKAIGLNLSGKR